MAIKRDEQKTGRVYTDEAKVIWMIQERADGKAIDWSNPVNVLRADGEWHGRQELDGHEQDSREAQYPKLPRHAVRVEINERGEYRVTVGAAQRS